jgi:hypothetical protein
MPEDDNLEDKPKKVPPIDDDDDDDLVARAANIKKAEKAQGTREADEAFRKAAEDGKHTENC